MGNPFTVQMLLAVAFCRSKPNSCHLQPNTFQLANTALESVDNRNGRLLPWSWQGELVALTLDLPLNVDWFQHPQPHMALVIAGEQLCSPSEHSFPRQLHSSVNISC